MDPPPRYRKQVIHQVVNPTNGRVIPNGFEGETVEIIGGELREAQVVNETQCDCGCVAQMRGMCGLCGARLCSIHTRTCDDCGRVLCFAHSQRIQEAAQPGVHRREVKNTIDPNFGSAERKEVLTIPLPETVERFRCTFCFDVRERAEIRAARRRAIVRGLFCLGQIH